MKHYRQYPIFVLLGGALCLLLRILQLRTGFEAETGLPLSGNLIHALLPAALAALAIFFFCLLQGVPLEPKKQQDSFAAFFPVTSKPSAALFVCGIFLLALSGAAEIFSGLRQSFSLFEVLTGGLSLFAAACLFPILRDCTHSAAPHTAEGKLLPIFVGCLVLRFIQTYRLEAISPILISYYVEILALTFLILSFYRLSSFAYGAGNSRRFFLYTGLAIPLCFAALADATTPAALLFYLAGILLLLNFLLLRLAALAKA